MSDDWTDAELEICVKQYWKAVKNKGTERTIDHKVFSKNALVGTLKARGAGSVERRMCNISAVLQSHNKPHVIAWKPLPNVGSGVTPRIEALLVKYELL